MENPIKIDELGGKPTIFGNIHKYLEHPYIIIWVVRTNSPNNKLPKQQKITKQHHHQEFSSALRAERIESLRPGRW